MGIKEELRTEFHRELAKCPTTQDVQIMLESQTAEVKEFIGHVCKSLPRPTHVKVARKWLGTRKIVQMVFVCPVSGYERIIESHCWSLWLKFCYSLAGSGVNVITGDLIGAAGSGIEAVKNAYNAYHEDDRTQQSLDVLMRAPLLLPTEKEQLIQSLRDQKFFDDFKYDPQRGQWVKNDADHPSGRSEPAVGCLLPAATSGAVAVDP